MKKININNDLIKYVINIIKDSSFILLLFITLTIVISSLLFFMKISITNWNIILALISTIIISFKFLKDKKSAFISLLLTLGIIILAVFICKHTYDLSYDGNTYHKLAIGLLNDGYNPVYDSIASFIKNNGSSVNLQVKDSIWVEHYPKASWIFAANFYKFTGNIESAKIIVMLMIYITFGISLGFLYKKIHYIYAFLISLFISINPISIVQVFTNYVDGLMGLLIYIILISLIVISKKKDRVDLEFKNYLLILGCSIIICLNLKFTGLVYAGMYSIAFFVLWMYDAYKKNKLKDLFKKWMIYYGTVLLVALLIVGYSPYIKNTVYKHNPLYPLIGEDKVDIMTSNSPKSFPTRNPIDKFFTSMYAKPANYKSNTSDKDPELRIPFKTNKEEIELYKSPDLRISGFGVFFSGIFTISIIVIIFYLIKMYKLKDYENIKYILAFIIVSFILILITDGSWWARYSPYVYLLPILAMYLLLKDKKIYSKIIFLIVMLLLLFNNGTIFYTSVKLYKDNYININQSLIKMKKISNKKGFVEIALREPIFSSQLYNFKDKNIIVKIKSNKKDLKNPVYVNYFYYNK